MPETAEQKRVRAAAKTASRIADLRRQGKHASADRLAKKSSARKKGRSSGPAVTKANIERGKRGRPMTAAEKVARNSRFAVDGRLEAGPHSMYDMSMKAGEKPQYNLGADGAGENLLAKDAYEAARFAASKVKSAETGADACQWAKASMEMNRVASNPASPASTAKLGALAKHETAGKSGGGVRFPQPSSKGEEFPDDCDLGADDIFNRIKANVTGAKPH